MTIQSKQPSPAAVSAGGSSDLLPPHQRFSAYRGILASPRDEQVDWWYFGTTVVTLKGMPPLCVINAATLMICRTETLSDERFAIHWDEVGCFSDYVTGRPMTHWLNPLTGRPMPAPQSFAEGPARYEVARTPQGVAVTLAQPGATINSIAVEWHCAGDRVTVVQRERKTRGFPNVDGSLPDPKSASGFEAVTELAFMAQWPGGEHEAQGLYGFALAGAPPWMGFDPVSEARATVHGVIIKAAPDKPPCPQAMRRLRDRFPEFFTRHGR